MNEAAASGRTLAIGDIHGCSSALHALVEALAPGAADTLVVLGDFIDWGPDSKGTVEQLIGLSGRCRLIPLLGNHEEMLLAALNSDEARRGWLEVGGAATLESYAPGRLDLASIPAAHLSFITSCRDYHTTDSHIFVHANYDPDRPIDRTPGALLRWEFLNLRTLRPHRSGKTVVVGHTPQTSGDVLDLGFLLGIDTDCSRGGWLTAIDVATGAITRASQSGRVERPGRIRTAAPFRPPRTARGPGPAASCRAPGS